MNTVFYSYIKALEKIRELDLDEESKKDLFKHIYKWFHNAVWKAVRPDIARMKSQYDIRNIEFWPKQYSTIQEIFELYSHSLDFWTKDNLPSESGLGADEFENFLDNAWEKFYYRKRLVEDSLIHDIKRVSLNGINEISQAPVNQTPSNNPNYWMEDDTIYRQAA